MSTSIIYPEHSIVLLQLFIVVEQTACCYMFVEGNPAPTFKFFKGGTEITEGGRYKLISDGENNNMIMLTIAKVKTTDEAEYRVYIENCHGSDEKTFMLYVSGKLFCNYFTKIKCVLAQSFDKYSHIRNRNIVNLA